MSKGKMDPRCPRQLKGMPQSFCPLAVTRLRAIRTAGRELSEEEENALPGCPWAINSQTANYCFFQYMDQLANENSPSDVEIASLNCLSIDTVKKVEKEALAKIRNKENFKKLREDLDGETAFEPGNDAGGEHKIGH